MGDRWEIHDKYMWDTREMSLQPVPECRQGDELEILGRHRGDIGESWEVQGIKERDMGDVVDMKGICRGGIGEGHER